jgi:hypothetical protein
MNGPRRSAYLLRFGFALLLLSSSWTGCVSKSSADARARAAFLAGQQQALMQMQQTRGGGPSVTITGAVHNSVVPWSSDLTLAKAVVAAEYFGPDPTQIVIVRSGRAVLLDAHKLLNGEDFQLHPGDLVEIRSNPVGGNPESPGTFSPLPNSTAPQSPPR